MAHRTVPNPKGHRDRLLPVVAAAFAELGYRRATTAELARRCRVRENVLYRVWPTKKDMFLASIEYVSESSLAVWHELLAKAGRQSAARRVLEYEAVHHGEFGLYRIVFAGLGETDDPDIRGALRQMYRRFHGFIVEQLHKDSSAGRPSRLLQKAGRMSGPRNAGLDLVAWAMVGIGTVSNISRELDLMPDRSREALFRKLGQSLLGAEA
jgi:AcrR family transcriptional regulator